MVHTVLNISFDAPHDMKESKCEYFHSFFVVENDVLDRYHEIYSNTSLQSTDSQANPLLLYEWKEAQLEPQMKNCSSSEFVFAVNSYVQQ